jgi:hypothetical protein
MGSIAEQNQRTKISRYCPFNLLFKLFQRSNVNLCTSYMYEDAHMYLNLHSSIYIKFLNLYHLHTWTSHEVFCSTYVHTLIYTRRFIRECLIITVC